jgi:hypothetical protein
MMTLARAGIGMAIAGGIALAVHGLLLARPAGHPTDDALYGMLLARQARLRSDCAAWDAAQKNILPDGAWFERWSWPVTIRHAAVTNALNDPRFGFLYRASRLLAYDRHMVWEVLPALRDPSFVGLEDAEDITVEGRNMPLPDHGTIVREDLFTRAGRASWLLKQVTGHHAPVVGVQTDPRLLVDISNDWRFWLATMAGGDACVRADLWGPR